MSSNGEWGVLVEQDQDMADAWDQLAPLPEPGENVVLDAFVAQKNISIGALVRLGARLLSETVLAFAYPGGIKYRDMESGARWNYVGADFTEMKIVPKREGDASIVIVAEGETDGAWLSTKYAVADVALLPVGARGIKPAYVEQLKAYDRVLVGLDDDEAGEAGWKKLVAMVPWAERFAPIGAKDWCEANFPRPFPERQAAGDRVGGLIFYDLTDAYEGKLAAPEIIVDDLLYDQGVHWFSGHPESGKSIMAMHCAWLVMTQERPVVWLDYEQGPRMTGQRLREMGVPLDLIKERFHWTWYPGDAPDELAAVAERWPGSLVVIDSMSKALAVAGIGENENTEVLAYTVKLIQASRNYGLPIIVIDHVTKADKDSDYARGAGTKQADTDVHWKVERVEDFTRDQSGLVMLTRHKDREGYLPKRLYFEVGDGQGGLAVVPSDGPDDGPAI